MRRTIKILVEFELDSRTDQFIRESSIERVINTSMDMVGSIAENDRENEDAQVNYEDWVECKPIITTMWKAVWNALYIETYPRPEKEAEYERALANHLNRSYELRKGES
jgi:hypothetical protein